MWSRPSTGWTMCFRYELDDLEKAAMQGRSTRAAAASAAWGLIDEAIAGFLGRRAARAAVPTIVALRQRFEALRQEVLAERPADAETATRALINRLLHGPSSLLRDLAPGAPRSARRRSGCWQSCSNCRPTRMKERGDEPGTQTACGW